jgi:hypothetical protein
MVWRIGIDASDLIRARRELEAKHIPFALAATLTGVVQDAQIEVQRNVRKAFTLRNRWTEQGIRIKPATPQNLQATIYTDTANRRTGAPDDLVRQEEGGEKVPVQGREHIAVPTRYLRALAPGVIPAELRPRALLSVVGGRYTTKNRKGQLALRNQKIVRGLVFFVQRLGSGSAIFARSANERNARDVVPFYILTPEVHVKQSELRFVQTIQRVASERLERQWDVAWLQIYDRGIRF